MARLIFVPQYPSKLRYQEWWMVEFPRQLRGYFSEVIVLGSHFNQTQHGKNVFAPTKEAVEFELHQMEEYNRLDLHPDDILLLNDLSYPGLFPSILFHKRPKKCFAICHATAKNNYDYFLGMRKIKYPIEKQFAKLFDTIFVGSEYHKKKLQWKNIKVLPLPNPSFRFITKETKEFDIISVARSGVQKRTKKIEQIVEKTFSKIYVPNCTTWDEYYTFLSKSKVMLITSKEETFGYQVVDAVINNCIPIAPRKFSYPELLPDVYLYSSIDELKWIISQALAGNIPVPYLKTNYESCLFFTNLINTII